MSDDYKGTFLAVDAEGKSHELHALEGDTLRFTTKDGIAVRYLGNDQFEIPPRPAMRLWAIKQTKQPESSANV